MSRYEVKVWECSVQVNELIRTGNVNFELSTAVKWAVKMVVYTM
jgi:hypothetical protein